MIAKSDTESSNSDDDSNTESESDTGSDHNNNEDMDQMAALLVKSFKKMVYRNFKNGRRSSGKGSRSSNSDKRNTIRNTNWKESRSRKLDKSKERCYNCDGLGHFTADCKKPRAGKKQALISKKRNWDDSSDSDDGINYSLMENANDEVDNTELKGSGLGYSARSNSDKNSGEETEKTDSIKTDSQVKLNKVQIKTTKFNPTANNVKLIHEEGTTSAPKSNLITEKSEQVHTNSVNIGSITQKQLKQKLKDLHMKEKKQGKILGYGKIKIGNVIIENVALVAGLKRNLISVSQICDRGYHVNFYEEHCEIFSKSDGKITLTGVRYGSLYEARVSTRIDNSEVCLLSRASVKDSWNWNKRLSHLYFNNINEFVRKDLLRGLPNAVFTPDGLFDSFQKAKQRKTSFKSKTESSILETYYNDSCISVLFKYMPRRFLRGSRGRLPVPFVSGSSEFVKPPEFKGEVDPVVARNWMKEMEKAFTLTQVSDDLKTDYASYFLKNEANYWWESTRALEGEGPVSWTRFTELFLEKYFPDGLRNQLEVEFLELK
ncbi:hypothetical protein AgCh_005182 [Apium graveolens]